MSEHQNFQFETVAQASEYVEAARQHYRQEHAEYAGRRNEEQQLIAEVTSDEARMIVDGALLGILALAGANTTELNLDDKQPVRAGLNWSDYRGEFERLLVGFGVMTNRLDRDGFGVPGYADLPEAQRMNAASALFSDFQEHNALRFGVKTAGVHRTKLERVHDLEEGTVKEVVRIQDRDKASSDKEIDQNMKRRGFATGAAAHPAGKISPDEYMALRREYPEKDKDSFDNDISFYQNARARFEKSE